MAVLNTASPELTTLLVAMIPVGELRVALPLAVSGLHLSLASAFMWSVVGNLLPVIPLYFFLTRVSAFLCRHVRVFDRLFSWYVTRTRKKFVGPYERWGVVALILFIAVPLPGTGAWTGTVAGWLVGMPLRHVLLATVAGVVGAGIIVTIMTVGVRAIL